MARIIPVIDIVGGRIVRAVGGQRDQYKPLRKPRSRSAEPDEIASALLKQTGAAELYVADLDAIRGRPDVDLNRDILQRLSTLGASVWVDAGLRSPLDEAALLHVGVKLFVVGTETADGPETVTTLGLLHGPDRVALSVDLQSGRLLGNGSAWGETEVTAFERIIDTAKGMALRRLIVLDLVGVGAKKGPATLAECRKVKASYPGVELWSGGGVRDWDDVKQLEDAGVDGVLVASALHDHTLCFPRPS